MRRDLFVIEVEVESSLPDDPDPNWGRRSLLDGLWKLVEGQPLPDLDGQAEVTDVNRVSWLTGYNDDEET